MTPSASPDPDLLALTRRLGHRKREVREAAERELHAQGSRGLEALLTAWRQEERWGFQRSLIGLAVFVLVIGGPFWVLHGRPGTDPEWMWACFIMIGGMIGAVVFMMPTRRQRNVAAALIGYDDPRALPYLAQSLRLITTDDPRRAHLIAKLRQILQEQPGHEMTFPGTKYVLSWQPERAQRRIRPFWLWLTLTLFMTPIMLTLYGFFFTGWLRSGAFGGIIGPIFAMPSLYTWLASRTGTILREEVTYGRRSAQARNPWLFLVGTGTVIALAGIATHFITHHHPSWPAVVWATLGTPICLWLSGLAGKRALPGETSPGAEAPPSPPERV